VSPGPRQTTIIPIETDTLRHTDREEVVTTTSHDSAADDEGFTVQTTPSSLSSTRRGSVLFPRRPPLTGSGGAGFTRPAVGAARSTTVSTPLTAVVPNIRKFQDIFSRRRSTTPPSPLGGEDTPAAGGEEGAPEEVKEEGEEVDEAEAPRLANEGSLASTAARGKIVNSYQIGRGGWLMGLNL
jgi:hypothetical protein